MLLDNNQNPIAYCKGEISSYISAYL
jgi:hypothetical protein